MSQEVSTRVQIALEQIGEDESLTSDLTDPAATALLDWMTQQIQAADAAPDDDAFRQQVAAIRSAARTAAKTAADEAVSAALIVERAQTALQDQEPGTRNQEPGAESPLAHQEPSSLVVERAQQARQNSVWNSLRRRVRRWVHRKV